MAKLFDAINADRSQLKPIEPQEAGNATAPPDTNLPSILQSPYRRCPLPASQNSVDSIRQLGQGSLVPRFRTQTPGPNNIGSTTGTQVVNVSTSGSSSSGGGSTTVVNILPTSEVAAVTTSVLADEQIWFGQMNLAPAAIMLLISANAPCRVELYGTAAAQAADASRTILEAPTNATYGLCSDVVLQGNSPYMWDYLDTVFTNQDDPQGEVAYVTITNISGAATALTLSFSYVPEQSLT
jgi:hypothetical protein